MRTRTFYIVNLNRNRIITLTIFLVGTLLVTFAGGYRWGRSEGVRLSSFSEIEKPDVEVASREAESYFTEKVEEPPNLLDEKLKGRSIFALNNSPSNDSEERADENSIANERLSEKKLNQLVENSLGSPARQPTTRRSDKRKLSKTETKPSKKVSSAKRHKKETRQVASQTAQKKRKAQSSNTAKTKKRKEVAKAKTRATKTQTTVASQKKSSSTQKSTKLVASNQKQNTQHDPRTALLKRKKESSSSVGFSNVSPKTTGAPVSASSDGRLFALQLGAFSNEAGAKRYQQLLKKQGFKAYVIKGKTIYKVLVGRTGDTSELEKLESRLKSKSYAPIPVTLK